jgi:C4-dicarboxylate transporter DctQ subunit
VSPENAEGASSHPFAGCAMRAFDLVIDVGAVIAAALLIATMLATVIKVVFRYGLHLSFVGVDQISGTLLLYVAMLGAAWVLRRDEHVVVDLLLGRLRERERAYLLVASSLVGALICFLIVVFGTMEVITSIQRGIRIPAEVEMPRAVDTAVIPLGFLLLGLQFLRRAVNGARNPAASPTGTV